MGESEMAERIEWVSTKTAAEKLGVSPKHLLRLREDKTFQKNKHWRDISPASKRRVNHGCHNCNHSKGK